MDNLIDAYFVYCIIISETCKIGKIKMKATTEKTLNSLLHRYSTYNPDCKIYKFVRVSNCHKA